MSISSDMTLPIGAALSCLRGAILNLKEAIQSKHSSLIYLRRKELAELLNQITYVDYNTVVNNSIIKLQLHRNLEIAKNQATTILFDASLVLSASVHLV